MILGHLILLVYEQVYCIILSDGCRFNYLKNISQINKALLFFKTSYSMVNINSISNLGKFPKRNYYLELTNQNGVVAGRSVFEFVEYDF